MNLCMLSVSTRGLLRHTVVHPFRLIHSTAPALSTKKSKQPSALHSRNESIPFRVVKLVDPNTGRLGDEWLALSDILGSIKREKCYIELVALNPDPVVKIINSNEMYNRQRAQAQKRKTRREQKEVQMSWAISAADHAHKMARTREELEAGNRVDLAYMPKSGQTKPTQAQMEARAEETLKALEDVGSEWKPRTLTKTTLLMHFQGHNEPTAPAGSPLRELEVQMAERAQKKKERREKHQTRQTKYEKQESKQPTSPAS